MPNFSKDQKKNCLGKVAMNVAMTVGLMGTGIAMPMTAFAANDAAIIQADHAVSLTLHKYDHMEDATVNADGTVNSKKDLPDGAKAVEGVEFSYLNIGSMNADGTYTLNAKGVELLGEQGAKANTHYSAKEVQGFMATKAAATDLTGTFKTVDGVASMPLTAGEEGTTTVNGLAQGLYMVVETSVPESVTETCAPFLVSLPMGNTTGDGWNYDVVAYPKNNTGDNEIDKLVKDNDETAYAKAATTTMGDKDQYLLMSKLPKVTTKATEFTELKFKDVMDFADYENASVKVTLYASEANAKTAATAGENDVTLASEDFTVENGGTAGEMTVSLTASGLAKVNAFSKLDNDHAVVVTYNATMHGGTDDSLKLGNEGNQNDVTVTYKRSNTNSTNTKTSDAKVYTYGINLTKTLEADIPAGVDASQAEFEIKRTAENAADLVLEKVSDGHYRVTNAAGAATAKVSPAADGALVIDGLEADTYTITETKAPSGYSLLRAPINVKIDFTAEDGQTTGTATYSVTDKDGQLQNKGATVAGVGADGQETGAGSDAVLEVMNNKSFLLPKTGGAGTLLVTVFGAAAAATAIGLTATKSRKKNESAE